MSGVIYANYGAVEAAASHVQKVVGGVEQTNGDLNKMQTALQAVFEGDGSEAAKTVLGELNKRIAAYHESLARMNQAVVQAVDHIQHMDHQVSLTFLQNTLGG